MNPSSSPAIALMLFVGLFLIALLLIPAGRAFLAHIGRSLRKALRRRQQRDDQEEPKSVPTAEVAALVAALLVSAAGSILATFLLGPAEPEDENRGRAAPETVEVPATSPVSDTPGEASDSPPPISPLVFSFGYETFYDLKVLPPDESNFVDAQPGTRDGIVEIDLAQDNSLIGCKYKEVAAIDPKRVFITGRIADDYTLQDVRELDVPSRFDCYQPSWSVDGDEFAFSCKGESSQFLEAVCIVDLTRPTKVERLDNDLVVDGQIAWTPDDRLIVPAEDGFQGTGIFLVHRNGRVLQRLTYGGTNPALSPNGLDLAFETPSGIFVTQIDGRPRIGGNRPMNRLTSGNDGIPVWSPNGQRLAFVPYFERRGGSLVIIDAVTGRERVHFRAISGEGTVADVAW